jgi:hypothetical protein
MLPVTEMDDIKRLAMGPIRVWIGLASDFDGITVTGV